MIRELLLSLIFALGLSPSLADVDDETAAEIVQTLIEVAKEIQNGDG